MGLVSGLPKDVDKKKAMENTEPVKVLPLMNGDDHGNHDHNHEDQPKQEVDNDCHPAHDTRDALLEGEEPSPYNVTDGQSWVLNVWQWLQVTPQHVIYIREPQLPWYGNLIKWLRINVLFKPIY